MITKACDQLSSTSLDFGEVDKAGKVRYNTDGMMESASEPIAVPKGIEKNNGNCVTVTVEDDGSSSESGIDETEFSTAREEAEKEYVRQYSEGLPSFSFQELLETLEVKKFARNDSISEVEIDPITNRLHLKVDRSNIRAKYGYDVGRKAFLYPEEALYLLDLKKIEIFSQHLSLSMERAWARLVISQRPINTDKMSYCTLEEYRVYQELSQDGYFLYRYRHEDDDSTEEKSVNSSEGNNSVHMDEDVILDESGSCIEEPDDADVIEIDPPNDNQTHQEGRGVKRKRTSSMSDEEMSDGAPGPMMEDVGEYFQTEDGVSYFVNTSGDTFITHIEPTPTGYTVDEADSDIEIVDEVIFSHGGVEIQEIGHCSGVQEEEFMDENEPVPSTSRGPPPPSQVVVDLVSSEDEEEEDLRSFRTKIWSKFTPNSKTYIKVPPASLIPENIPVTDKVYEYDLKNKSDNSDLELEFLVDEVSLNDDTSCNHQSLSTADNWKEWRTNIFREARDVMNDSLLASSDYINGASAKEKLCLWENNKDATLENESKASVPCLNRIVYEVYGPAEQGYSRLKAFEGKPAFYVSILRENETIPDLSSLGSSIDGVPILHAIVCDSEEIVYMKADGAPLESLFDSSL